MSNLENWTRRGEWLELQPSKSVIDAEDRDAETIKWLTDTVGMPEKLLRRLTHEKKIQWRSEERRVGKECPV